MSKEHIKHIADALGDDALAEACGVSVHSVRAARQKGVFPASWFLVVRGMCARAKLRCPDALFSFKKPQ